MKTVKTQDAVGMVLCHDVTQILPGEKRGPLFRRGHRIGPEDVEKLLSIGKENLYVWEEEDRMVHEDDAARILYDTLAGENLHPQGPSEGKIEAVADCDGLLKIRSDALLRVNLLPEMMIATKPGNTRVSRGEKVAATRIIPLAIEEEKMEEMKKAAGELPIVTVLPFHHKKVGLIITGSEVFKGRIEDKFTPLLEKKLASYDTEIVYHALSDDAAEMIGEKIREALAAGCDLIFCTGGMSVDPDDKTPAAIRDTGARIVRYGSPVLPGAMFLLSYLDGAALCGLPGGVIVSDRSMLERILPRLMADDPVTYEEIAAMGEGGLS